MAAMGADDERFHAKTTVLIENVTHHVEEEEKDWFPKVRAGLSRTQLQEIGAHLVELKAKALGAPRSQERSRRSSTQCWTDRRRTGTDLCM